MSQNTDEPAPQQQQQPEQQQQQPQQHEPQQEQKPQPPPLLDGESVQEYTHSFIEMDGTRVVKRIIIRRIKPNSAAMEAYLAAKSAAASASQTPDETGSGAQSNTSDPPDTYDPSQLNEFKLALLRRHNELRELHGSPPLVMSREMCNYAQEWADHIAHSSIHEHRKDRKKYS